jgi:hypothetical protein
MLIVDMIGVGVSHFHIDADCGWTNSLPFCKPINIFEAEHKMVTKTHSLHLAVSTSILVLMVSLSFGLIVVAFMEEVLICDL